MTDTALIGSSCALGVFWSSKRYFDYLIDETNLSLLRGKANLSGRPSLSAHPSGKGARLFGGIRLPFWLRLKP